MRITFGDRSYEFRPWKPAMGRVFTSTFAMDCETTRIDEARPWLTPAYVLGAAFDGERGYFIPRDHASAFFRAHEGVPAAFHTAPFDLDVIHTLAPKLDVYRWVDGKIAWDTQLLHRLYVLGTEGHPAGGKGESGLEHCARTYLGVDLPKDVVDSKGDPVRLSYGKWLGRPMTEIEGVYLDYLGKDVVATRLVYRELRRLLDGLLAGSGRVWGFVSPAWLREQIEKWGPQTHHVQLRAAVVLRAITANGLWLDLERRGELATGLRAKLDELRKLLREFGYLAGGKGSDRSLQAVLGKLEFRHPGIAFPRTESNRYATSHEALQDLVDTVPFVKVLLEYRETEKLLGSFVKKMGKRTLHPSFNVLARSGRTSSFGEINAQNLPTDDRVRSCFVPSPGNVFLDEDFKTIELVTLAQACVGQFGLRSRMAEAINAGKDLHTLVAAQVKGKAEADVTKGERKKAKPINFGKPGGMGHATLKQYAKTSYGISYSDDEVRALSDAWFALFPEMRDFLADTVDTPMELAAFLGLTPASHHEHTGDRRFVGHPENVGREQSPHRILGMMCLKALKEPCPRKRDGRYYSAGDVDYFWSSVGAKSPSLGQKFQKAVASRKAGLQLQREVKSLVGRAGVFTFSGRLRARATYGARHNTIFQGLAADGAKLALWNLWRAGYRLVNFVHDQVLVEVPAGADLKIHADRIRELMISGMKEVVPDVLVDVSFAATRRWYKEAEAAFGEAGELLLWEPEPAKDAAGAASAPAAGAAPGVA